MVEIFRGFLRVLGLKNIDPKLQKPPALDDDINDILGNIEDNIQTTAKPKANPFLKTPPKKPKRKLETKPPTPVTPVTKKVSEINLSSVEQEPDSKKLKIEEKTPENPHTFAPKVEPMGEEIEDFDLEEEIELDDFDDSDEEISNSLPKSIQQKQKEIISQAQPLSPVPSSRPTSRAVSPNPFEENRTNSSASKSSKIYTDSENLAYFYWLDAFEEKYSNPGEIWLTGRILTDKNPNNPTYDSCCLKVKNIPRQIFCLLSEDCEDFNSAYEELSNYCQNKKIDEFKCKPIENMINCFMNESKNYKDERNYMLVEYNAKHSAMPPKMKRARYIEQNFNTNQTSLEAFLMRKNVKGPSFLKFDLGQAAVDSSAKFSYCAKEIVVEFKNVQKCDSLELQKMELTKPPKLTLLTLNVVSAPVLDAKKEKTNETQIIGISGFLTKNYDFENPPNTKGGDLNFDGKFYGISLDGAKNLCGDLPEDFVKRQKAEDFKVLRQK